MCCKTAMSAFVACQRLSSADVLWCEVLIVADGIFTKARSFARQIS